MDLSVNYAAVFAAMVVSMVVGFVWYSPAVLGKPWMKLRGFTDASLKKAQKEMGPLYGVSALVALVTAYMLSHVMGLSEAYYHYPHLTTGITSAFFMWLGFVMPVQVTAIIFGDKKWGLFAIDTGYQLASILSMGIVLGLM